MILASGNFSLFQLFVVLAFCVLKLCSRCGLVWKLIFPFFSLAVWKRHFGEIIVQLPLSLVTLKCCITQ